MGYRATLSCDQPDCGTSLSAPVSHIDFTLHYTGWKVEETEQGTFYTCPNHEPDTVPVALRRLANAGRTVLMELRDLDDQGYYVVGFPADNGGAALHVHPYAEDDEGPFVSITQSGRSFHARLMAGDDNETVVFDEDDKVWD